MTTPDDLLRRLAARGESRGATDVFAASATGAARPPRALVAAVVALVLVAGATIATRGDASPSEGVGTIASGFESGSGESGDVLAADGLAPGASTTTSSSPGDPDGGAVVALGATPPVVTQLEAHASCDSVLAQIQEYAEEAVGPYGLGGEGVAAAGEPVDSAAPAAGSSTGDSPVASTDFSTSNVQEVGVDEADLLKTDGRLVVAIANGALQVVSVVDQRLQATMALPARPSSLYLVDDAVVVIGQPAYDSGGPETPIMTVDLGTPSAPSLRSTTWIEGFVRSSRLQSGQVRLVITDGPRVEWASPTGPSEQERQAAIEQNRSIASDTTLHAWLPDYRIVDDDGVTVRDGLASACSRSYTPVTESGFGTTTIVTLDPGTGQIDPGTSVAATPMVVYASPENLYISSTTWRGDDSRGEVQGQVTDIHRFDLTDPDSAPYEASGSVRGLPVNQFSFSERDGHLRVATTVILDSGVTSDDRVGSTTDSVLWVLDATGPDLDQVSRLPGLGEDGEVIQSVRFVGDFAYVVTFRRTDPLYVIDVSDPNQPILRGELHVPGFSSLLQPLDDGELLGIGQDADENGWTTGLQVSRFDVSDPASPARTGRLHYPGASSLAEHDHLAALHWAPTDIVVIPLLEPPEPSQGCAPPFVGAVIIDVSGDDAVEVGRISHTGHADGSGETDAGTGGSTATFVPIVRSAVAAGHLLTLSEAGLAFGNLSTGAETNFVAFEGGHGFEQFDCPVEPQPKPEPEPEPEPNGGLPLPFP